MVGFGRVSLGRHVATVFEGRIWFNFVWKTFATVFDGRIWSLRFEEMLLPCLMLGFAHISHGRKFAVVFDGRIL